MAKTEQIEIKISGKKGSEELTPDNYDIRELMALLKNVDDLLSQNKDRTTITYELKEGSVKNVFKTSMQVVLAFNAWIAEINASEYSIEFLNPAAAKVFELIHLDAKRNNYEYNIKTSLEGSAELIINKDTKLIRGEAIWVNAEYYLYGTIVDAGGKNKANIHLDTKEFGTLTIATDKRLLSEYHDNPLYKTCGIRATGLQNIETGEIDRNSLKLIEIIDYNPVYDEEYMQDLIKKATRSWAHIDDPDEWLQNIRGYEP